jgi:hypothetical protein
MKNFQIHKLAIVCSTAFAIFILTSTGTFAEQVKISDLRSQGWTEIARQEEIKKYPGERPYEKLIRVVQIVHFVFEKDGKKKYCWISYDSQRDELNEHCKTN